MRVPTPFAEEPQFSQRTRSDGEVSARFCRATVGDQGLIVTVVVEIDNMFL